MRQSNQSPVETLDWLSILLLLPLAAAALVDMPRVVRLGSVTALGVLTSIQCALAFLTVLALRVYPRRLLWHIAPFGLFLLWMVGRSAFLVPTQSGAQNATTYTLFALQFVIAGTLAAKRPAATLTMLRRGFWILDVVTLPLVAFCCLRYGLPSDSEGQEVWLVGPRSVALVAIVPLAWHLAAWCHGQRRAGLRALLWILAIVCSLSRSVTAIAVIAGSLAFLAHWWLMPGRLLRKTPTLAAGAFLVIVLLVVYAGTFRQRFFEGYNTVSIGGVEISTSGRNQIWPVVIESAWKHPMLGGGLGSSQAALTVFDVSVVGHPHNDYLRAWHDGGFIGLTLLLISWLPWVGRLRRQWVVAIRQGWSHAEVDFAGLLAMMGLVLAAITDNPVVYAHVMGPMGLIVGTATGLRVYSRVYVRETLATANTA